MHARVTRCNGARGHAHGWSDPEPFRERDPLRARAASGTAASGAPAEAEQHAGSDSTYGSDRTMRRIHTAASPSSASPTTRHTRPTLVPTSAVADPGSIRLENAR